MKEFIWSYGEAFIELWHVTVEYWYVWVTVLLIQWLLNAMIHE